MIACGKGINDGSPINHIFQYTVRLALQAPPLPAETVSATTDEDNRDDEPVALSAVTGAVNGTISGIHGTS